MKQKSDTTFIEKNPVTDDIKALVPEQYRSKSGINWSKQDQRFYVFLRLGYRYDPERKRGIDLRKPLGSIRDGVFKFSPSFLRDQEIEKLQQKIEDISTEKASTALNITADKIKKVKDTVSMIQDPRQQSKTNFPLEIVLSVMLLAAFAGYTSAVSIANYWKRFHSELSMLFEGFPEEDISHDTINRIMRLIDKKHFEMLVKNIGKVSLVQAENRIIHIDGQAVRASKGDGNLFGRYFFNAYDSVNNLLVGHMIIGTKENEITHEIEFVRGLDLHPGDIITADALNTQTAFVRFLIEEKHIDYCLALKENHKKFYSEVLHLFAVTDSSQIKASALNVDCGHGRIENRSTEVISGRLLSRQFKEEWRGIENGCLVKTTTKIEAKSPNCKESCDTRYFISSHAFNSEGCADYLADVIRRHWSVENNLHWVLDTAFHQDRIQCTDENYLSNRVSLNKIGLNVLKKASEAIKGKTNKKYSMPSMQELCSTPAGAIETFALAIDVAHLFEEVKD